jgi:hypothetical protein
VLLRVANELLGAVALEQLDLVRLVAVARAIAFCRGTRENVDHFVVSFFAECADEFAQPGLQKIDGVGEVAEQLPDVADWIRLRGEARGSRSRSLRGASRFFGLLGLGRGELAVGCRGEAGVAKRVDQVAGVQESLFKPLVADGAHDVRDDVLDALARNGKSRSWQPRGDLRERRVTIYR